MPRPLTKSQRYMPGLDGVRAVAVLAVIGYHLDLPWIPGGLLGVGVFFTLSGYLITDLLLAAWERTGTLELRSFWVHRARRLLPALFVMLPVVVIWVAVAAPRQLVAVRGQALASALYVGNWWLILQHVSYFSRFGPPSPLGNLWSLAVEEQFYLVWPWLLFGGLAALGWWQRHRSRRRPAVPPAAVAVLPAASVARQADLRALGNLLSGRALRDEGATTAGTGDTRDASERRRTLAPLTVVTLALAAASAVEMARLYHPSFDPSRVYDGTDTRAFALLIGAALAMVWPSRALTHRSRPRVRHVLDAVGVAGLVVIGVLLWKTTEYSPFLYSGGMVVLSVATAMVVASVAHPATVLGRALGWGPLRWVGSRSYAIYLWHYPIIVLTAPSVAGRPNALRDLAQVGATLVVAELSWRLVETPVRAGGVSAAWEQWRIRPRHSWGQRPGVMLSAAAGVVVIGLTAVAVLPDFLTGPTRSAGPGAGTAARVTGAAHTGSPTTTRPGRGPKPTAPPTSASGHTVPPSTHPAAGHPAAASSSTAPTSAPTGSTATTSTPSTLPPATFRTRCSQVVHIGDSTSASLVSSNYLPDPTQRLPAQYARVGVQHTTIEIEGGTSVVETIGGQANAYDVAQKLVRGGYRGCWVIALGTNDAADVYVGSNVSFTQRIEKMMSVVGNDPVLWVNTRSLQTSGPYAESNMQRWDEALTGACARYPNMAVFDWASVVQRSWFIADGIHYTSEGSAKRAAAFADALARAFPSEGPAASGPTCVVHAAANWDLPDFRY